MQPIVLAAKSNLPACVGRTCKCTETVNDDGWGGTSAMLELQWTLIDEKKDSLFAKEVRVETTSVLFISQMVVKTLDLNHTHTIQVEAGAWTGFMANNIERFATVATVQLRVQQVKGAAVLSASNLAIGIRNGVSETCRNVWYWTQVNRGILTTDLTW